jgi:hypothetical protein
MSEEIWDEPAWLKAEVKRLREVMRLQYETNLFRNKQLDDIGEILCEAYDDVPEPEAVSKVREVLQRERPEHIGPPAAMHVAFSWRDPSRPDGYNDALPGDGYGFCEFVENETRTGLMMQFDCAGIIACATLDIEPLRETLAKGGWGLSRLTEAPGFASWDIEARPTIEAMATRITELERDLKSTEAENERLMDRVYGKADERDHVQVAVDRVEELKPGDTVPMVPTIDVRRRCTYNIDEPIALIVHLPLPGYPGHAGALHEMLEGFKVWGIELPKQEG